MGATLKSAKHLSEKFPSKKTWPKSLAQSCIEVEDLSLLCSLENSIHISKMDKTTGTCRLIGSIARRYLPGI